ncbi:MAG: histidine phosphatase family protein [Alphaproteobacteria bacterium]
MTTLIIARHGNTFEDGETPRRVGARTDLPLTGKGREQSRAIGRYLKENQLIPDVIYASTLQRTIETAKLAVKESGVTNPVFELAIFNEIDYGPDENKTEQDVMARIGREAIANWDQKGVVPPGWLADPALIIRNWLDFAGQITAHDDNETVLIVTSNGLARFAPHITGDFESFRKTHPLKLTTGALGIFVFENGKWLAKGWNIRP